MRDGDEWHIKLSGKKVIHHFHRPINEIPFEHTQNATHIWHTVLAIVHKYNLKINSFNEQQTTQFERTEQKDQEYSLCHYQQFYLKYSELVYCMREKITLLAISVA